AATSKKRIKSENLRVVVANLAPTLDVNVTVKIATKKPVTIVRPNDWQKLKPVRLLKRTKARFWSIGTERLIDVREASGLLVGRVGYVSLLHHAVVTYGGIRSGTVPNLAGVLLGENNS